jgi:hypothetical protein
MSFAIGEKHPAGQLPMPSFNQYNIEMSISVQVANAGIRRGL